MSKSFTLQFDLINKDGEDHDFKVDIHMSKVPEQYRDDAAHLFNLVWDALPEDYEDYGTHFIVVEDHGKEYNVKLVTPSQTAAMH
jgi:hypothetical protein